MADSGSRRGRAHDAEGTREAILNAAEEVFAEHGFDGARIDAIAEVAGYNKSLIFHYYGDKLGLYAAVLQRIDRQMAEIQTKILGPLLEHESFASDAETFRTFLGTVVQLLFDMLLTNPRMARMLAWEAAEGWQTYRQAASLLQTEDVGLLRRILRQAKEAGLIRAEIDPVVVFSLVYTTCLSYFNAVPLFQMVFAREDLLAQETLMQARQLVSEFMVRGIMGELGNRRDSGK
jgi:TetR/AcrR family transcriptional regulator